MHVFRIRFELNDLPLKNNIFKCAKFFVLFAFIVTQPEWEHLKKKTIVIACFLVWVLTLMHSHDFSFGVSSNSNGLWGLFICLGFIDFDPKRAFFLPKTQCKIITMTLTTHCNYFNNSFHLKWMIFLHSLPLCLSKSANYCCKRLI